MEQWIEKAKALGFDTALPFDALILRPRQDIRGMCENNICSAYGLNWTCPPFIGSLEECAERLGQYRTGLLLQTVGRMNKYIDTKVYRQTGDRHMDQLHALADEVRKVCPDVLVLGAGGCQICPRCAYPDPCRFPERAVSSMEGYGLFVTQVCRDAGAAYYHGERTITYTGCILFK